MQIKFKPLAAALCVAGLVSNPVFAANHSAKETNLAVNKHVSYMKKEKKKNHVRYKRHRGDQVAKWIKEDKDYLPFDLDVPGKAFVSTGPYVGVPLQFSGSNLIINSPSIDTDTQLLSIRQAISKKLKARHLFNGSSNHSHLMLSGVVEGQAIYSAPSGTASSSDLALSTVGLDALFIGPSDWTLGFMEIAYDDAAPAGVTPFIGSQTRSANSRLYVSKAFVTIGNFDKSPFYTSFGQMYAPFGRYSSTSISSTLPKLLARTKMRGLVAGFKQQTKNAFYGSLYVFRGDSRTTTTGRINNGGANLGYQFAGETIKGRLGAGFIANIADSAGMQVGAGFERSAANEKLGHRVPAFNVNAALSLGQHIDLIAEGVAVTRSFSAADMTYKSTPAKPYATDVQAAYSFKLPHGKPGSVGVGYDYSYQAMALGLPQSRMFVAFNTSLWRNTLQAIEIVKDHRYPASATATGAGNTASPTQSGGQDYAITAQFDYFF